MATIGFIGLGNMGGPMARNLVKAGHALKVFDLSTAAVSGLVSVGATGVASASEAARDVDAVVTMLPAGEHVRGIYLGEAGLLKAARKGTLFIDSPRLMSPQRAMSFPRLKRSVT